MYNVTYIRYSLTDFTQSTYNTFDSIQRIVHHILKVVNKTHRNKNHWTQR